jgi:hypothetical protein
MIALARNIGRFLLRFVLFYWICTIFPFPLDLISLPLHILDEKDQPTWLKPAVKAYDAASSWLSETENDACTWIGKHVLDVEVVIQPTGSGDTMRAYVGCLCAAGIALGLALGWTLAGIVVRRRKTSWNADPVLHATVRILVRFYLFQVILGYGLAKVFPLQFMQPSSSKLAQQVGDMSPMGLLWTFMGFSTAYQMFTGAIEVLGAILLTTRRTTLLGALITTVAMTQIFALNMCFDVPVKLYSFHFLMMAIFLALPDMPRLVSVLVLGRGAEARPFLPPWGSVRIGRLALGVRTVVVVLVLYATFHENYQRWQKTYGGPPPPLFGRWEVASMQVDDKAADKSDPATWTAIDINNRSLFRIFGTKPPHLAYQVIWNAAENKLSLKKFSTPDWSADFNYALPAPDRLELHGAMNGKRMEVTLKSVPIKQYELMNRGFHWIQELPYNR